MKEDRFDNAPIVVAVNAVGKSYANYSTNLYRFARWFGLKAKPVSEYWTVRDVSFQLRRGECVAIIGQNGAGKSTLLKIITGTVRQTTGIVSIAGRVNAILELGLGFNPEFTGRENVHVAGGLMGLTQAQVTEAEPQIEAFAELGRFIDQPLRVYSSGMQARLAFSLATAFRPELLIVDEVLSVGDSYFSHKSFNRIREFRDKGTSVLFVTHSMSDVRTLCNRVILLDQGQVLKDGAPDEVVDYYNALIAAKEVTNLSIQQHRREGGWLHSRSGSGEAGIRQIALLDANTGEPAKVVQVDQRLLLRVKAVCQKHVDQFVLGLMVKDRLGHVVWGSNTWHSGQALRDIAPGTELVVDFQFRATFGPGSYAFTAALHDGDTHLSANFDWQDNVLVFDVVNSEKPYFLGTNWVNGTFNIHASAPRSSTPDPGLPL